MRLQIYSANPNASGKYTTSSIHKREHGTNGHTAAAAALGVDIEIVHIAQETLIAMAPERFSGLRGNFGHTQIFSHQKLASVLPEWSPQVPVTESVAENIAWMDKHNLVPDSDADDLEDQIIEAVRNLPRIR